MVKNSRVVVIDNGAGRIKYSSPGAAAAEFTFPQATNVSSSSSSSVNLQQNSSSSDGQLSSMPNCVARMNKQMQVLVGDEVDSAQNGSLLSYTRPFDRGYITNMHCQIEVWSRLFNKILKLGNDIDSTSICLTEAPFVPESIQNDMNEVIFEDFGFDSCLRRPSAWFSSYEFSHSGAKRTHATSTSSSSVGASAGSSSSDRINVNVNNDSIFGTNFTSSCTIIDSGFSFTHILPFVDGKCIKKSVKRVNIGGKLLTNYLKEMVSYRQWNMMDEFKLMDNVKEDLCYISNDFHTDLNSVALYSSNQKGIHGRTGTAAGPIQDYTNRNNLKKGYILPDFQTIMKGYVRPDHIAPDPNHQELTMETERFCVPEVLFHPSDVGMDQGGIIDATAESLNSLNAVDGGLASANIVLTGGNCKFPQFETRFYNDLRPMLPDIYECKTFLPNEPENYSWYGANRFATCGDGQYQKACVSKKEYFEYGNAYVNEKYWRGW